MTISHKLSVVIITLNSEYSITRVLQSLSGWCDEIIIVDSGSTDKTLEIAQQFNCQVYHRAFSGYGEQKRYAISLASNDWVLSIDADEIVTPELRDEIIYVFSKQTIPYNGFKLPITLVFMGKKFQYGNEYKKAHLRLFNKKAGNFNQSQLHEKVEIEGELGMFKNQILHYSYKDISHYFDKFNKYSTIAAQNKAKKKHKGHKLIITAIGPWSFFQYYIFKLNILNGFPGFVWSLVCAYYAVIKYIKLYEINISEIPGEYLYLI